MSARTLRMVVAGMQWLSKSYNFALTCNILAGVCSSMISFAICAIRASQSGGGIGVFSVTFSLQYHRVSSPLNLNVQLKRFHTFGHVLPQTSIKPALSSCYSPLRFSYSAPLLHPIPPSSLPLPALLRSPPL